jgi:hypothetical protein
MKNLYIPSTAPGKTWNVYFYKPQGRPAYVTAVEGEYEANDNGFSSFKFVMFQNRSVKEPITGPATDKKKKAAFDSLVAKMKADGLIA